MQKMYLSTTFFAMSFLADSIALRLAKSPQSQNPRGVKRFWLVNRFKDQMARQMPKDGRGQRDLPSASSQSVLAAFVFPQTERYLHGASLEPRVARIRAHSCPSRPSNGGELLELRSTDYCRLNKPLRHRWLYGFPWAASMPLLTIQLRTPADRPQY